MNKILVGGILAVVAIALMDFFLRKESDPRSVCKNLAEDEICVCTADEPTSTCGIEKKIR